MQQIDTTDHWFSVLELLGKGWNKGSFAQDEQGGSCMHHNEKAVRWCLDGAMSLVALRSGNVVEIDITLTQEANAALDIHFQPWGHIVWNDMPERTYEDVLTLVAGIIEKKVKEKEEIYVR